VSFILNSNDSLGILKAAVLALENFELQIYVKCFNLKANQTNEILCGTKETTAKHKGDSKMCSFLNINFNLNKPVVFLMINYFKCLKKLKKKVFKISYGLKYRKKLILAPSADSFSFSIVITGFLSESIISMVKLSLNLS
jgi:hypothetical protein